MTNSDLRYSSGVQADNSVRIARVAAAGRVAAARIAREKARAAHDETCGCKYEYEFCADRP